MVYQAFYRVYRPQTFGEMSGQQHVKQTLQNALLHNKTTHAYLFSGPRGTGKTSAAKIFAKALNCENGPAKEPCNECPTCLGITEGSDTDVIEFDAASNSRVEEMREIIEKVRFAPSNSRFKVYIIDEVHMLSNSAFNALLKTLEEPPSHAVFILATTEPHKLPLTIISRCQRFDFKPITQNDIVDRMKTVLHDTGIESDEDVLKIIAQAALGGMRDALSMLDQVVSFSGERLTVEDALLVTGSIGEDVFYQLAGALLEKDAGAALSLFDRLITEGKDVSRLAEDLITFFRDLLLLRTAPELQDLLELVSGDDRFKEMAKGFDPDVLYSFIDILSKTQQEMRFSNHAKVYIESALLKMIHIEGNSFQVQSESSSVINPAIMDKVTELERVVSELQQQIKSGASVQTVAGDTPVQRKNPSRSSQILRVPTGKINEVLKSATKEDIQTIRENWAGMMQTMQKSHSALLEETEPVAASSQSFVLKFKYEIHCLMASENTSLRSSLSNALQSQTGIAYEVVYVPEDGWQKARQDFIRNNNLERTEPSNDKQSTTEQEAESVLSFVQEAEQENLDPIVTKAENIFGKEFIEVYDD
ncbi:DNA polymerase III subunit gamma/tau [Sporosarcina sp. Marseille-Q4063]|uniref:DNA polymerase III subunit gamma/tau n=1 Tax=Sporosarcina sp. Marseille-Q4063 TaxID=2810514 RepID=UPI001BAEBFFA|nr:DNA polymerase III subunit gamma/tau [Sporosarcina sp. Marseille-Q4063]QUW23993.1 DNA polymerase III subunit gamma/tau [Sporosarcina sp. Marseille-Q4063]